MIQELIKIVVITKSKTKESIDVEFNLKLFHKCLYNNGDSFVLTLAGKAINFVH